MNTIRIEAYTPWLTLTLAMEEILNWPDCRIDLTALSSFEINKEKQIVLINPTNSSPYVYDHNTRTVTKFEAIDPKSGSDHLRARMLAQIEFNKLCG